jgi:hypothetical protein
MLETDEYQHDFVEYGNIVVAFCIGVDVWFFARRQVVSREFYISTYDRRCGCAIAYLTEVVDVPVDLKVILPEQIITLA